MSTNNTHTTAHKIRLTAAIDRHLEDVPDSKQTTTARAALDKVRADLEKSAAELARVVADTATTPATLAEARNTAETVQTILLEREAEAIHALAASRLADAQTARDKADAAVEATQAACRAQDDADAAALAPLFGDISNGHAALNASRSGGMHTVGAIAKDEAWAKAIIRRDRVRTLHNRELRDIVAEAGLEQVQP